MRHEAVGLIRGEWNFKTSEEFDGEEKTVEGVRTD